MTAAGGHDARPEEKDLPSRPIDVPLWLIIPLGFLSYFMAVSGWFLTLDDGFLPGRVFEALYLGLSVLAPSDAYTADALDAAGAAPGSITRYLLLTARWLGALFFALTVAKVALAYAYQGVLKRFAKWRYEDHVVIIGNHPFCRQAAEEAVRRGLNVVHFEPGGKETVPDGILTLDSDLGLAAMLEWSAAHRARALIFATPDNAENADMARRVFDNAAFTEKARQAAEKGVAATKARAGPHIFVFTDDDWFERREELDYNFHRPPAQTHDENVLDSVVEFVGESRSAARAVMTAEPVFRLQNNEIQHIVLVGFGAMGQALLAEYCETQRVDPERKQRATILDPDGDTWTQFVDRCPAWSDVLDASFINRPIDALDEHGSKFIRRLKDAPPAAIYVSTGTGIDPIAASADVKRVVAGLAEDGYLPEAKIGCPIFACTRGGTARLQGDILAKINSESGKPVLKRLPIIAFGSWRDVITASRVLDDEPDLAAYKIHATHNSLYSNTPPTNWSDVSETNRYSSRSAANFVPALLHAAGFDLAPWLERTDGQSPSVNDLPRLAPGFPLVDNPSTLVKLARLEHARWCAERHLRGFQVGPKDPDRKRHPGLKAFDAIDPGSKSYNIQYISALQEILLKDATGPMIARPDDAKHTIMRPTDLTLIRDAGLELEDLAPRPKEAELTHA